MRLVLVLTACAILGGCSDSALVDPDASEACWPEARAESGGSAEVGLEGSDGEFFSIERGETVELIRGGQGGYHIEVTARISGLEAGDPMDILSPTNPHTLFSLATPDGLEIGGAPCPVQRAYAGTGAGDVLLKPYGVRLNSDRPSGLFPSEMIVRVEVIDAEYRHAVDEETIFIPAPPEPDAGADGGSRDAGAGADGGSRDAGASARAPR